MLVVNINFSRLQKERFLKEVNWEDSTKEAVKIWFRGAEKVEIQNAQTALKEEDDVLVLDLANFNREQVLDLLKSYNSKSRNTLNTICTVFSRYFTWCLTENLVDAGNAINFYEMVKPEIDKIIPESVINNKFFSYTDVLEYIDNTIDIRDKFIIYSLYLGIKGIEYEELLSMRYEDFNEQDMTMTLVTGRVVKVDDVFVSLMKKTNNSDTYYPNGAVQDERTKFHHKLFNNGFLIRQCKVGALGKPVDPQIVTNALSYIKEQSGNRYVSSLTLYKNGLINFIKNKFEEKGVTLKDGILKQINGKLYEYDKDTEEYISEYGANITARMLRREIKDYLDNF